MHAFQYRHKIKTMQQRRRSFSLLSPGNALYFLSLWLVILMFGSPGKHQQQHSSLFVDASPVLRQVHVITRHGSRRPLTKRGTTLEEDTTETSLLTPLGQQEHYQLGEWLRERYSSDGNDVFGSNVLQTYNPGQSHLESSSYERTLSSANSLALGLFPLETRGLQLVPAEPAIVAVYSHDRRNDIGIRAYDKCPAFQEALEDLYASLTWQHIQRDAMPLLQKLAGMKEFARYATVTADSDTTWTFVPLKEVWNVYDAIAVAKHECPVTSDGTNAATCDPNVVSDPSLATVLTEEEWENLQLLSHAAELLKYGRDVVENKVGGVLWHTILQRMTETVTVDTTIQEKEVPLRLYVTSAHYPTILGLFAALGIPFNSDDDRVIPEYASALIVELYQNDDDSQQRYVKILYKSGVKTEAVPVLVSSQCLTSMDPGCKMEDFVKALEPVQITPEQWCRLCGNTDVDVCMRQELEALKQSCSTKDTVGVILGTYLAGVATALILVCVSVFCQRRCRHQSSVDIEMNSIDLIMDVKPPSASDGANTNGSPSKPIDESEREKQVDMAIYT